MTDKPEATNPAIVAIRRHWAVRAVLVVLPAVVSSIAAYTGASGDAKVEAQVVKNKAESGYQVTRGALEDLQERVARLEEMEAELAALKRAVRAGKKRGPATAVKVVVSTPAPRAPLPADLDKALEHKAPAAPAASPAEAPKP